MKNLNFSFLFFSFLFFSVSAFAQDNTSSDVENPTRKGRFIGDLNFGFDNGTFTQKHDTYVSDLKSDYSLLLIDGTIGYTIIDNLEIGLRIAYDFQRQENVVPDFVGAPGTGETTLNKIRGGFTGLGARYFFGKKQFKPFIGVSAGRSHVDVEIEGQGNVTELSGNGFGYIFDLGFAYFINDHIGFEVRYLNFSTSNSVTGGGNASGFAYDLAYEEDQNLSIIDFGFIIAF